MRRRESISVATQRSGRSIFSSRFACAFTGGAGRPWERFETRRTMDKDDINRNNNRNDPNYTPDNTLALTAPLSPLEMLPTELLLQIASYLGISEKDFTLVSKQLLQIYRDRILRVSLRNTDSLGHLISEDFGDDNPVLPSFPSAQLITVGQHELMDLQILRQRPASEAPIVAFSLHIDDEFELAYVMNLYRNRPRLASFVSHLSLGKKVWRHGSIEKPEHADNIRRLPTTFPNLISLVIEGHHELNDDVLAMLGETHAEGDKAKFNSLTTLCLSGCQGLTEHAMLALLEVCPGTVEVLLEDSFKSNLAPFASLAQWPALRKVTILQGRDRYGERMCINDDDLASLGAIGAQLESLSLPGLHVFSAQALADLGDACPNLTYLQLGSNESECVSDSLLAVLGTWQNLQTLKIGAGRHLTEAGLICLQQCPSLVHLHIFNEPPITGNLLKGQAPAFPRLRSLRFLNNGLLPAEGLLAILEACPNLVEFNGLVLEGEDYESDLARWEREIGPTLAIVQGVGASVFELEFSLSPQCILQYRAAKSLIATFNLDIELLAQPWHF